MKDEIKIVGFKHMHHKSDVKHICILHSANNDSKYFSVDGLSLARSEYL